MSKKIIVIGAGIGGLTAAALLAKRGCQVQVYDQAIVPGGCASTFKRKGFIFDVGATQVAGLEEGGIHHRILQELNLDLPEFSYCDPACAVFLPSESNPISIWRDPQRWQQERESQFPGSALFWQILKKLYNVSLEFQGRDPVLPVASWWDLVCSLSALRLETFLTAPFALMSVLDLLRVLRLDGDIRLKTFLDIQLKLYSQTSSQETALLYGATALSLGQAPQGLFHLQGSMQVLSDLLVEGLTKYKGTLSMRHLVEKIDPHSQRVTIRNSKTNELLEEQADEIIANVTVQNLLNILGRENLPSSYCRPIDRLESPSGAFVLYLGVKEDALPANCPPHLQFLYDYAGSTGEINSLFVSVSKAGDGRAPAGMNTITASSFTEVNQWWQGDESAYRALKENYTQRALKRLGEYFDLKEENIIHQESATPKTFASFTARERGIVGGIGQRVTTFGPFSISTRTPFKNIWLVGDSTHPGEGTAGVSYSAFTVVRQIEANLKN
jgi:C-3',4' desaturase CrtD